jgi:OOP family OmpA-OmpF porin
MTPRPLAPSAYRALTMVALLATGCSATLPADPPVASHPALQRLAQIGYGRDARFERCRIDLCPQRTPKTLPKATGTGPITGAQADDINALLKSQFRRRQDVPP